MTKRRGPGSSPVTMTPTRTPVATAPALRAHTGGERCYATMKDRRRLAQTCAFIVRTRRPTAATGANSWARGLARVGACDSDSARASKQEPPGHGCIQHACLFAAAQKTFTSPGPWPLRSCLSICRSCLAALCDATCWTPRPPRGVACPAGFSMWATTACASYDSPHIPPRALVAQLLARLRGGVVACDRASPLCAQYRGSESAIDLAYHYTKLQGCKSACLAVGACEGIVVALGVSSVNAGAYYLRGQIKLERCGTHDDFNLYLRPPRLPPSPPPALPSPSLPRPAPPAQPPLPSPPRPSPPLPSPSPSPPCTVSNCTVSNFYTGKCVRTVCKKVHF